MSLKKNQPEVSLKLMQNMIRLNCKFQNSAIALALNKFSNEDKQQIYKTLHSLMDTKLNERDEKLMVNDIQSFLEEKQLEKTQKEREQELFQLIQKYFTEEEWEAVDKKERLPKNLGILIKAIVDHALKRPMDIVKIADFIKNRFNTNNKKATYHLKI